MPHRERLLHVQHESTARTDELWLRFDGDWFRFIQRAIQGSPWNRSSDWVVSVSRSWQPRVVALFEERLGLTSDADLDTRLVACFRELVRLGEFSVPSAGYYGNPGSNTGLVGKWLAAAGVPHLKGVGPVDAEPPRRECYQPLRTTVDEQGRTCRLVLKLDRHWADSPTWTYGLEFAEEYWPAGEDHHDPVFWAQASYASAEKFAGFLEERLGRGGDGEVEDRLISCFTDLIERGELPVDQPPGELRDRVAGWFREARVPHERNGTERVDVVLEADSASGAAELSVRWATGKFAELVVVEESPPGGRSARVLVASASIDRLTAHLAERFAVRTDEPDSPERFLACLRASVRHGEVPRTGYADRVAAWCAEVGVPFARDSALRRHVLVDTPLEHVAGQFSLHLGFSIEEIWFSEKFDYSDADYGYGVMAPYSALDRLVDLFETRTGRPGSGDLERRLVDSFTELVRAGTLGAARPIKANRDWVTERFIEADVPYVHDHWAW